MILEGNCEFESLTERKKAVTEVPFRFVESFVCTWFVPRYSRYKPQNPRDSDHRLGDPLIGYEKEPEGISKMVHTYDAGLKHDSNMGEDNSKSTVIFTKSGKRFSFDRNVLFEFVPFESETKSNSKNSNAKNFCRQK